MMGLTLQITNLLVVRELDECNGLTIDDGTYAYIITKEFPFVPRCWRGLPDRTFIDRPDGR